HALLERVHALFLSIHALLEAVEALVDRLELPGQHGGEAIELLVEAGFEASDRGFELLEPGAGLVVHATKMHPGSGRRHSGLGDAAGGRHRAVAAPSSPEPCTGPSGGCGVSARAEQPGWQPPARADADGLDRPITPGAHRVASPVQ